MANRVGLIGAGFMGMTHARAYARIPGVEVVTVVDRNLERADNLARETGGRSSADAGLILDDPAIDVVDITLPTPLHPEYAMRALQAGKHVIIEKPLALTLDETDAILACAQRTGKYLMVAHVIRFWPEYVAIQNLLKSGRLGRPLLATAYRLSNMPQWADWFRDPAAFGGGVHDLQIHDLDFMNLVFGTPQRVKALGLKDDTGGWNHVVTQLEYAAGRASVEAGCMMPRDYPFTAGLKLMFEKGVVEYHYRAGGASFELGQPQSYLLLHEPGRPSQPLPFEAGDGYVAELEYFMGCVRSGTPPTLVSPGDARLAVQTALASRASLETGEIIQIAA